MTTATTLKAEPLIGTEGLAEALNEAGLPVADLDRPGRMFFRFVDAGQVIGYGGLEGAGPDLLLRLVAVVPEARNLGHGGRIVTALEREASARGAARLHLLTTTAARFFGRQGYAPADRATAPAAVASCEQFRSLCPASAAYLVKSLTP